MTMHSPTPEPDSARTPAPFPPRVRIATILWLAIGGVGLPVFILVFLAGHLLGTTRIPHPDFLVNGVVVVTLVSALGLLGLRVVCVRGRADLFVPAVGSMVFGVIYVAIGVGLAVVGGERGAGTPMVFPVALGTATVLGWGLIGIGVLALTALPSYRTWRADRR